jgi:hypothetical protein
MIPLAVFVGVGPKRAVSVLVAGSMGSIGGHTLLEFVSVGSYIPSSLHPSSSLGA